MSSTAPLNRLRMFATLLCLFSTQLLAQPRPILPKPDAGFGSGSGANALLSDYTEAQFLEFVPKQSPRNEEFLAPVVPGDTGWSWDVASPNQLRSTPSGTIFPNSNPAYPRLMQDVTVFGKNGILTNVRVPYYLAAGSTTRKVLVQAYIDHKKRGQLRSWLKTLTAAYLNSGTSTATRDDRFARRIAVTLDAWAHAVPNYFMTEKTTATFINATADYVLTRDILRASQHDGMAHEWKEEEIYAFDAIYDSPALTALQAEKGYDARIHIRNYLFFNIGDYFNRRVPVSLAIKTNLSDSFSNLALVARAFKRPEYITWMGNYLDATVNQKLTRDGVLVEGVAYSDAYLNENYKSAANTRDYFLTHPADTAELVAIRNAATGYADLIQAGRSRWDAIRLPNGQFPPFGDTNFNFGFVRNAGSSGLLGSYGHAALGTGAGSQAVQLNTNFSTEANHMRPDVGAFTLWALGTELISNVRYFQETPGSQWTEQVIAHNAVTVDRSNMSRGVFWNVGATNYVFTPGHLYLYEPGNNGLALTEVDGQRPYANKTSRYQRILILNTTDLARPYVIDAFRVTGGTTHDYTLHGSIRYDQAGEASFPLTANPAPYPLLEGSETWTEPATPGATFPYYGFFRNVSSGTAPENFQITFRESGGTENKDSRLWVTGQTGANVHLARTPVAARNNGKPANFYGFWRPSVIVRKRIATGPQHSLFANVVEPLRNGVSTIQSVRQLPLAGGATKEAVALRITFTDGRVDTFLVNLRNPRVIGADTGDTTIATADGLYSLSGRIGVHVQAAGGSRVWTVAASSFKYSGGTYTPPTQVYNGTITGVTRKAAGAANDAFIVSGTLPTGTALRGRHLSMTFGSYQVVNQTTIQTGLNEMFEIDRVEDLNGQTHVILKSDPRLTINGTTTTELMAPQRTFTGANTYEITLSSSAAVASADTTPPVLSLPTSFSAEATSASGATVTFVATATDAVSGTRPVTVSKASGTVFPLGTTTVTATATDAAGNTATGSFNVTVRDTTAPTLAGVTVNPATITANGQMIPVAVQATSTDAVDPTPTIKIISITSSPTDPNTATTPDIQTSGNLTASLRAEGAGRVYTLTIEARDDAGNPTLKTTTVTVEAGGSAGGVGQPWEAESLVSTATGAPKAVQSDPGAIGGLWMALQAGAVGNYIEYTLPAVPAGTYQLKMRYKAHPNRGKLRVSFNGATIGDLDQYAPASEFKDHPFGMVTVTNSGNQVVRLTVTGRNAASGVYTLSSDNFMLAPPPPITREAEAIVTTASGAVTALQSDSEMSGQSWLALQADSVGDYVEYTFTNVPAGTYKVSMEYKDHPNRGILQMRVDGNPLGAQLDQYAPASTYPTHDFGTVNLSAGNHVIRLTVTGRNANAGAFTLSCDTLTLTP